MLAQTTFAFIFVTTTVLNTSCSTIIEKTCDEISTFIPYACLHTAFRAKCRQNCVPGNYLWTCGTRSSYRQQTHRNTGESDIGQWPWHVSLQWKDRHICGASILSPHYIITAAHCLDAQYTSANPDDFTLLAGINQYGQPGKSFRVHSFKNHPGYSASRHTKKDLLYVFVEDNIGIIRLNDKLELGSGSLDSVCLPDLLSPLSWKHQCFMIGYSAMHFLWKLVFLESPIEHTSHYQIETVPMRKCNHRKAFSNTLKEPTTICAGISSTNLSLWDFDSGGGLVCEMDGRWYLRGILASSGFTCDNNSDAIFTNISHYENWIITSIFELQDIEEEIKWDLSLSIASALFLSICILSSIITRLMANLVNEGDD